MTHAHTIQPAELQPAVCPSYQAFRAYAKFVPQLADFAISERNLSRLLAESELLWCQGSLGLGDISILVTGALQLPGGGWKDTAGGRHLTYAGLQRVCSILAARADKVLATVKAEQASTDTSATAAAAAALAAGGLKPAGTAESRRGQTQAVQGAHGSTGGGMGGPGGEPPAGNTKSPNVTQLTRILNPHIGVPNVQRVSAVLLRSASSLLAGHGDSPSGSGNFDALSAGGPSSFSTDHQGSMTDRRPQSNAALEAYGHRGEGYALGVHKLRIRPMPAEPSMGGIEGDPSVLLPGRRPRPLSASLSMGRGVTQLQGASLSHSLPSQSHGLTGMAGVMVASGPPVLVREIIPTPKDACEFPHVRSRLQGVKELLSSGEAAAAGAVLRDLHRDWETAVSEKALKDVMRRARKAASSGAGDSGVDPEAEFLKGPPPELPPEGAVWVLLMAGACAMAEGQAEEAGRLLDAAQSHHEAWPQGGPLHVYHHTIRLCQGLTLYSLGCYAEALARFDEASDSAERMARAAPSPLAVRNRAAALNNAGAACLMLGSRSQAVKYFRMAVELLRMANTPLSTMAAALKARPLSAAAAAAGPKGAGKGGSTIRPATAGATRPPPPGAPLQGPVAAAGSAAAPAQLQQQQQQQQQLPVRSSLSGTAAGAPVPAAAAVQQAGPVPVPDPAQQGTGNPPAQENNGSQPPRPPSPSRSPAPGSRPRKAGAPRLPPMGLDAPAAEVALGNLQRALRHSFAIGPLPLSLHRPASAAATAVATRKAKAGAGAAAAGVWADKTQTPSQSQQEAARVMSSSPGVRPASPSLFPHSSSPVTQQPGSVRAPLLAGTPAKSLLTAALPGSTSYVMSLQRPGMSHQPPSFLSNQGTSHSASPALYQSLPPSQGLPPPPPSLPATASPELRSFLFKTITLRPATAPAAPPAFAVRATAASMEAKAKAKKGGSSKKGDSKDSKKGGKDGKKGGAKKKKKASAFEITWPSIYYDPPSYNVANVKAEAPKKKGKVVKKKK